jgi:ABC-type sugar transport system ATPase subunit
MLQEGSAAIPWRVICGGVTFSYGSGRRWTFSRSFEGGCTYQLIGANGTGKSTIGKLITGIETPNMGHILVAETPLSQMSAEQKREALLFVPQEPQWMFLARTFCSSWKTFRKEASVCGTKDRAQDGKVIPAELLRKIRSPVLELSTEDVFLLAVLEVCIWERPVVFFDEYPDFEDQVSQDFVGRVLSYRESQGFVTIIARHIPADIFSSKVRTVQIDSMLGV